jgi:hypothetical protein
VFLGTTSFQRTSLKLGRSIRKEDHDIQDTHFTSLIYFVRRRNALSVVNSPVPFPEVPVSVGPSMSESN